MYPNENLKYNDQYQDDNNYEYSNKEQCIFHYNTSDERVSDLETYTRNRAKEDLCINACLNNDDCDLVRVTHKDLNDEAGTIGSLSGSRTWLGNSNVRDRVKKSRCELLKWNRLPETEVGVNIDVRETELAGNGGSNTTVNPYQDLKSPHLGGHLINGKMEYDLSNFEGVMEWNKRVSYKGSPSTMTEDKIYDQDYNSFELDYKITGANEDDWSNDTHYRSEFYSD